jgi:hypothetical protein
MPKVRSHLGRYPKYKEALRNSDELTKKWRDHHIPPSDLSKVNWLCENCDTLAKHKSTCLMQDQASTARWADVEVEEKSRVAKAARVQVSLARASRDSAAVAAAAMAAPSQTDNIESKSSGIEPSLMQDADEEIAEEKLLFETAG